MLWIASTERDPLIHEIEQRTQLTAKRPLGHPIDWKTRLESAHVVVLRPPIELGIVREIVAAAQEVPMIMLDPDHLLDEFPFDSFLTRIEHITTNDFSEIARRIALAATGLGRERSAVDIQLKALLVGESEAMAEMRALITLAGPRGSTVLVTGETGTGKELVARAIHAVSQRAAAKLVAVNCGALPENLIESELFGHAKGAFTGAVGSRIGRFEQANKGTLFLDEIGEMPLGLQVRLLRVLQERELQRVGSSETSKIDVRVIAASNRQLTGEVAAGRFREDLYYRLNVIPIHVPSLRDRRTDIPALAEHLLVRVCVREGLLMKRLSNDAIQRLVEYSWPGNVRQLEHAVEMAAVLSGRREMLSSGDFSLPENAGSKHVEDVVEESLSSSLSFNFEEMIGRLEKIILDKALSSCGGNKAKAASLLGMKRTTLLYKMKAIDQGLVA